MLREPIIEIGYQHAALCQLGFPRKETTAIDFERKIGSVAICLQAGKVFDGEKFVQQRLPYGGYARLILAWVSTQAKKNGSPKVAIGESAKDFLVALGKHKNGNDNARMKSQLLSLSVCNITIGEKIGSVARTLPSGSVVERIDVWMDCQGRSKNLWPREIVLSDRYFESLCNAAVPLNMHAIYKLKGASLALDLYSFLAYRLHRIDNKGLFLGWKVVFDQFGSREYFGNDAVKNFRKELISALLLVKDVYPEAKFDVVYGGLQLKRSAPPVPPKRFLPIGIKK